VDLCFNEFYHARKKNGENMGKILFTPFSKVQIIACKILIVTVAIGQWQNVNKLNSNKPTVKMFTIGLLI
jgi:hypothetical protein